MAAFNATPRLTLAAMAALCLAAVGAALVSQQVFDMRPCPWCILQRMIFIAIALLCLVGASVPSPVAQRSAAGLAVVLSLLGGAAALYQHFNRVERGRDFGNGRYARQVLDSMITRQASRIAAMSEPTTEDLTMLLPEDLPT